jgi:hypothetical protein
LVGKPEGKRPSGRPKCRWDDNIKMDIKEMEREDVEWVYLAQDRDHWRDLVNIAMNLRVPQKVGNFTTWVTVGFSRTLLLGVS